MGPGRARSLSRPARPRWASVSYWEANAPWYDLWLRHNHYHAPIQNILAARVRPEWRILDIGGGGGVLALFLRDIGCRIVLLEPARAMRTLFYRNAGGPNPAGCDVDRRPWEDVPLDQAAGFDLILACNSLHVSGAGFEAALKKVFAVRGRNVCVVAEEPHASGLTGREWPDYTLVQAQALRIASSRVYHRPEEALDHAAFRADRALSDGERRALLNRLVFEAGHYWIKDEARDRLEWWARTRDL